MKIYLSGPFFNATEKYLNEKIAKELRKKHEVIVPSENEIPSKNISHEEWAKNIFKTDVSQINECDALVVTDFGSISDAGTAWECGYAFAIGKPVYIFSANEHSLNSDISYTHSLMMVNGCTHFFNSFEELLHFLNTGEVVPFKNIKQI
jgi:nucleoside 2-deoxyribosyltransferase